MNEEDASVAKCITALHELNDKIDLYFKLLDEKVELLSIASTKAAAGLNDRVTRLERTREVKQTAH